MSANPSPPVRLNAPERSAVRQRLYLAAAAVAIAVVAAGAVAWGQRAGNDDDPSARQESVAERGALVMPFDLDATTHVFAPAEDGGVQTVTSDDPADEDQIALVRGHLRDEVAAFRLGDFGDPAAIHGHNMPGLSVLESSGDKLTITYRDVGAGGEVTYQSSDPAVVRALHEWFTAQLMDHGDDARAN